MTVISAVQYVSCKVGLLYRSVEIHLREIWCEGLTGLNWLRVVSDDRLFLIYTVMSLSVLSVQGFCPTEQLSSALEVSYLYLVVSPS